VSDVSDVSDEITIQQVIVHDDPAWKLWPGTEDADFSHVCAMRDVAPADYEFDGQKIKVVSRFYPAYKAFAEAGEDPPMGYQWIDNNKVPSQRVLDIMLRDLTELSKECSVVLWDHARNCYPAVAQKIPELFRLAILPFADDCPGSSENKTFPVAKWFDALYYQMKVWDFNTGVLTANKYAEIAPRLKCYFKGQNETVGLAEGLSNTGFNVMDKINNLRRGVYPAVDLAFVGYRAWHWRRTFLDGLNNADGAGLVMRLHGTEMKHGEMDGRYAPNPGYHVSKLYSNTLFGPNAQVSSIFNSRLMDLWRCGVVQMVYDPHAELESEGFVPWVHYVPFDGTVDDLLRLVREMKPQRDRLADIMEAAAIKVDQYQTAKSSKAVYARIYGEHIEQVINGRPQS